MAKQIYPVTKAGNVKMEGVSSDHIKPGITTVEEWIEDNTNEDKHVITNASAVTIDGVQAAGAQEEMSTKEFVDLFKKEIDNEPIVTNAAVVADTVSYDNHQILVTSETGAIDREVGTSIGSTSAANVQVTDLVKLQVVTKKNDNGNVTLVNDGTAQDTISKVDVSVSKKDSNGTTSSTPSGELSKITLEIKASINTGDMTSSDSLTLASSKLWYVTGAANDEGRVKITVTGVKGGTVTYGGNSLPYTVDTKLILPGDLEPVLLKSTNRSKTVEEAPLSIKRQPNAVKFIGLGYRKYFCGLIPFDDDTMSGPTALATFRSNIDTMFSTGTTVDNGDGTTTTTHSSNDGVRGLADAYGVSGKATVGEKNWSTTSDHMLFFIAVPAATHMVTSIQTQATGSAAQDTNFMELGETDVCGLNDKYPTRYKVYVTCNPGKTALAQVDATDATNKFIFTLAAK